MAKALYTDQTETADLPTIKGGEPSKTDSKRAKSVLLMHASPILPYPCELGGGPAGYLYQDGWRNGQWTKVTDMEMEKRAHFSMWYTLAAIFFAFWIQSLLMARHEVSLTYRKFKNGLKNAMPKPPLVSASSNPGTQC